MNDIRSIVSSLAKAEPGTDATFAFSLHKAGSSLMHGMINDVCVAEHIPHLDLPAILFHHGIRDQEWLEEIWLTEVFNANRLHFGFRQLPAALRKPTFDLSGHRVVLLVRDARDALVSQYYSFGGKHASHPVPKANPDMYINQFKKTSKLNIDQYVLHAARGHLLKLEQYRDSLNLNKIMLCRYEDVYYEKEAFLRDIFNYLQIEVSQETLKKVAKIHDVRPEVEDISKHIRQGTPGDHKKKLQPITIDRLNEMFGGLMVEFGYSRESWS